MKSKQYAKRLLSLIIATVMILTMLPVSALAAGADDVMIEDQAETIVEEAVDVSDEVVEEAAEVPDIEESEDAVIVEESVDEIAEADPEELAGDTDALSRKVKGVQSGSNMRFEAKLAGLTVSAVVPTKRAAKGSYMKADIVDVSAYEDAAAKKNYGKVITGLYGLKLHFVDKKGKEIKHINTSNITVTVDGLNSSYYFIGRIDNKVKKIQRGTEPTFTFTEKKAYTYVIAGLEDDGLLRATAETDSKGNKRFNLNEENVNIEVVAPKGAFADGVAMEASDVTNGAADGGDDTLVGASSDEVVAAYEISFYNEEGDEQQPSKEVTVSVNVPLDMTKGYELIHIADDGTRSGVEGAVFTENGVTFTADSFSVYAVVDSNANGGFDFDKVIGSHRVRVKAPDNAFEAGTQMIIQSVDPDDLLKVVAALGSDQTYSFNAIDISFYKNGVEVEPKVPVEVTWESVDIDTADEQVVHLKDDGDVEIVKDAVITEDKAVFTATSFSTYVTTRLSTINLNEQPASGCIFFDPSSIQRPAEMSSGNLDETHPEIENYTYVDAYFVDAQGRTSDDPVISLGAFDYWDCDEDGNKIDSSKQTYIYYRTVKTSEDSDLIIRLAEGEKIYLRYKPTPITVTYRVIYNGTTYTLTGGNLPEALVAALGAEDAAHLEVNGPASVERSTLVPQAITVDIPRGYTATVRIGNNTQLGSLGDEPTYSVSNDKVITKSGELLLQGVYDFPASTTAQTVTVNLTKRSSFTFNAHYFLRTVYTGGNSTRYGDYRLNQNTNARITGDGSLNTTARKTFSADSVSWTFTTNNKKDSNKNQTGDQWMVDALEINGTTIEIPYANPGDTLPVSKTTTLPSGTVITVSLTNIVRQNDNNSRLNYRRTYTITAENCYEDLVISGGNIVDLDVSEEIIPEVLDNVEYSFYGFASSDAAHSTQTRPAWQSWGVGEPIAVGSGNLANSGSYLMYAFGEQNNQAMRFSVPVGYVNPMIAYVSTLETDLISNVTLGNGLSLGAEIDGYHPITGNPTNGYYNFRITGNSDNSVALLRIKAELALYDVRYYEGTTGTDSDVEMQAYDDSGYNVVDKPYVVINKSAPHDKNDNYIFMYYTIDGDRTDTHYSPSEKIPLENIYQLGVYDSGKNRYVIPFVAHWEKTEDVDQIAFTANFYLDDVFAEAVHTTVPERSSVYIDIDSQTMIDFMDKYNWQLFYDELGSDPFVRRVSAENNSVELRIYSKFYVYHSATNTLELHTTKEMEVTDGQGNRSIGNLDITDLTTDGYYYGGYYKDYLGAHVGNVASGKNLVKEAADKNNLEGSLSTADIEDLSNGKGVVIPEYSAEQGRLGTQYDPVENEGHLAYWTRANAFMYNFTLEKAILKNSTTDWFGDRIGEKGQDTEVLKTGGVGTAVQIARAGIYYLHEVPSAYLATPKVATVRDEYGKGDITKMFLLSAVDINIFKEGGVKIVNADTRGTFAETFTLSKYDNGTNTVVSSDGQSAKTLFSVNGYLSVTDGASCMADGAYTLNPYWITYDNVQVYGNGDHVRNITVSNNVVS